MPNAASSVNAYDHFSVSIVRREFLCVSIKLRADSISPSARKKNYDWRRPPTFCRIMCYCATCPKGIRTADCETGVPEKVAHKMGAQLTHYLLQASYGLTTNSVIRQVLSIHQLLCRIRLLTYRSCNLQIKSCILTTSPKAHYRLQFYIAYWQQIVYFQSSDPFRRY